MNHTNCQFRDKHTVGGIVFYKHAFLVLFNFSMKFLLSNRIAPDGTLQNMASMPGSAELNLGLYCLPMSHKRDARLKGVNVF